LRRRGHHHGAQRQNHQRHHRDPGWGPLTSDPNGLTAYNLPLPGSPLINHGPQSCAPTDQRGALRPDACDIGAVEFGGLLPRFLVMVTLNRLVVPIL
jgi:hypothetical protein